MLPLTGVTTDAAARATPGTAATAVATLSYNAGRWATDARDRVALTLTTSTGSRSNPPRKFTSRVNVRTNSPAATIEPE